MKDGNAYSVHYTVVTVKHARRENITFAEKKTTENTNLLLKPVISREVIT